MNDTNVTKNLLFIDNGRTYEELFQILDDEYNMKIARNMEAAKDILNHGNTDIQVLLIHADMEEDIYKAIEFVKEGKKLTSIPILIYTDEENSADKFTCLESGVIDCITKPFISKIIKNRLKNAIALTDSRHVNLSAEFSSSV